MKHPDDAPVTPTIKWAEIMAPLPRCTCRPNDYELNTGEDRNCPRHGARL